MYQPYQQIKFSGINGGISEKDLMCIRRELCIYEESIWDLVQLVLIVLLPISR